ncbi:protein C8orf37 homolog isoform X2 [Oryzias latipes]|uniref:Cilia- and flagella-associated protein 418 n=1 Tax=Oryzias latipes TaxID=8090 RepID=A0A3B3IFI3_ORYLA|nr:protein C8orf37 homolog isoform X1 [Oryzias latipes]XP_023819939.1 protein C8orf37 homolog isoform X2 [Oryzias latipes]
MFDADQDFDKLLDEVEKKFCCNVSVESSDPSNSSHTRRSVNDGQGKNSIAKPNQPESDISEDIDALLEELLEDKDTYSPQSKSQQNRPKETQVENKLSFQIGRRKCCPVFVGGSSVTNGVGTATSKRSCDQLRCVSCDFRVVMFDDCEWDQSCDYLFLRNNMPDCQKLRKKLKKKRGQRAYACQCSWFSASEPADLRDQPQLRWVCGKHPD